MSAQPHHDTPMTEADYLDLLRESDIKYEFIDGDIYAMSGASEAHVVIETNLVGLLYGARRKGNCNPFTSTMAVHAPATGGYFYPDVIVVCGEPEYKPDERIAILLNPTLIIEILSPSTELKDRSLKFDHYAQIAALRDYVLVAQDKPRVECFSRGANDTWILTRAAGLEASIKLPTLDVTLALADIYERVTFGEADAPD